MSSVVIHNSPHIAITRTLSRSTYEIFKNLATPGSQKWEECKSYRSRSALVDCRTDLVIMLWLLVRSWRLCKHGDIAQVATILKTSCYDMTRY